MHRYKFKLSRLKKQMLGDKRMKNPNPYSCGVSVNRGRRKRYGKKRLKKRRSFLDNVWYDR